METHGKTGKRQFMFKNYYHGATCRLGSWMDGGFGV